MKKLDVLNVYKLINDAKFTKMSSDESFKLLKFLRVVKPIVTEYNDYNKTVAEKYKLDYENFDEQLEKGKQYEVDKTGVTEEEYYAIVKNVTEYNEKVNNALKEDIEKDVELSFEKLSESGFKEFLGSNEFKVSEASLMMDILI